VRDGREIDGAALVLVQPTVMAFTAPSMPGETTGNSSMAFHPAGSGGAPPPGGASASPMGNAVGESPSGSTANGVVENGSRRSLLGLSVKLDIYDGTTCLETFLASVRFATYYRWSEEDELFCLRPILREQRDRCCGI